MRRTLVFFLAFAIALPLAAQTANDAVIRYSDTRHPVYGTAGMVTSQSEVAARIGAEVLEDGGSAVDAAIATGFALAVTLPRAGNIGGGGFMVIHDAESGENTSIDYREMAPPGASRDMFLDANGDADPSLSRFHHLSSGVPGTVAGFWMAHQRFGNLPWKRLVQPAIELARDGTTVTHDFQQSFTRSQSRLCRFEAACNYFYKPGRKVYDIGERFVQSDLAWSLQQIADHGADAFYRGEIADKIVAEMSANGGLIDHEALAAFEPTIRDTVSGSYRGYEIVTMAPPSSGGIHILQMLNILEHFPVADLGYGSADGIHLLAEVMRLAYADRSEHLGDPDYWRVPVEWLISKEYGKQLAATIDMQKARSSDAVKPGVPPPYESEDTTHFSIIDKDGNVVANTYTLNLSYGSGIAVAGAGFLLNNEMDDFVSKPGTPNAYGLLGGDANAIEPGKRPLSSMSPTIVFADGEPWFATGCPGGSRIISAVLQTIVNTIDHSMNFASAVSAPRMHHQWYPDVLLLEGGFSPDTLQLLEARGHSLRPNTTSMGSVQTAGQKDGLFMGASDPRRPGSGSVAPRVTGVE